MFRSVIHAWPFNSQSPEVDCCMLVLRGLLTSLNLCTFLVGLSHCLMSENILRPHWIYFMFYHRARTFLTFWKKKKHKRNLTIFTHLNPFSGLSNVCVFFSFCVFFPRSLVPFVFFSDIKHEIYSVRPNHAYQHYITFLGGKQLGPTF